MEENEEVPRAKGTRESSRDLMVNDDDIIVNQHTSEPLSFDIDIEPSSKHRSLSKHGNKGGTGDVVVLHSLYDREGMEER